MTMAVKFKIGFTIDAETLFGILSKFLPLENLAVEEVVERPERPPAPILSKAVVTPIKRRAKRSSPGANINEGVNGAIVGVLNDGEPHRYAELKKVVTANGYAGSGIGSRIKRLHENGVIVRVSPGLWRLAPDYWRKAESA
jgi:hypothetical protein